MKEHGGRNRPLAVWKRVWLSILRILASWLSARPQPLPRLPSSAVVPLPVRVPPCLLGLNDREASESNVSPTLAPGSPPEVSGSPPDDVRQDQALVADGSSEVLLDTGLSPGTGVGEAAADPIATAPEDITASTPALPCEHDEARPEPITPESGPAHQEHPERGDVSGYSAEAPDLDASAKDLTAEIAAPLPQAPSTLATAAAQAEAAVLPPATAWARGDARSEPIYALAKEPDETPEPRPSVTADEAARLDATSTALQECREHSPPPSDESILAIGDDAVAEADNCEAAPAEQAALPGALSAADLVSPSTDPQELQHEEGASRDKGEEPAPDDARLRRPGKYQPRLAQKPRTAPKGRRIESASTARSASHEAELWLLFQSGGWAIAFGALLHRTSGTQEAVEIRSDQGLAMLWPMDERLFEVLELELPAPVLEHGFYAEAVDGSASWMRSARSLHVFAPREGVSGFCTVPRLKCGVENVVICSAAVEPGILDALAQIGITSPEAISAPLPDGWRGYRGLYPRRLEAGFDGALEALNPAADVTIDLSGGVRTGAHTWLASAPPAITVAGGYEGPVLIDETDAELTELGWRREGWDAPGQHRVEHGGVSRSYRLEAPPESWPAWPASAGVHGATVCGALVSCDGATVAPPPLEEPCWLIGARPGQCTYADPSVDFLAAAPFDIVWAIPASNRRRSPPILLGTLAPPSRAGARPAPEELRWCSTILEASRLHPRHADPATARLWRDYAKTARSGWKRR